MVHALKEAWRVLRPEGMLIDLRPISTNAALEVLVHDTFVSAGQIDESPGLPVDLAADEAILQMINMGAFGESERIGFEVSFYWQSLAGMQAYTAERWEESARIPAPVMKRAVKLESEAHNPHRVRIRRRIHLATYVKRKQRKN